jgi:putative hydrolase of HD superfamily
MENANVEKVLEMCIFHDIAETRSGDQTWIHKRYVTVDEDRILAEQLSNISKDDEIKKVMSEYLKRESLEAKVAKDADNIDQYLLVKEYDHRGNKEASSWLAKDVTNLLGLD